MPGHIEPLAWHVPPVQQPPPSHWFQSQQGCPSPPHVWHVVPPPPLVLRAHAVPAAEQMSGFGFGVWQHGWPEPPQLPHEPAAQVPKPLHVPATATHFLSAPQQPRLAQVSSAQQGCPPILLPLR